MLRCVADHPASIIAGWIRTPLIPADWFTYPVSGGAETWLREFVWDPNNVLRSVYTPGRPIPSTQSTNISDTLQTSRPFILGSFVKPGNRSIQYSLAV